MLSELSTSDLASALEAVAAETLAHAAFVAPPIDAVRLARRLGLTIAWDDAQQGRARLVNLAGGTARNAPSILLKHDPRQERLHWAVAHEIGEALAQRVFAELAVDPSLVPQQAREVVANGMASRLLLPRDWFHADACECDWDLLQLKAIYTTASHELIARHMLDFAPPVIISVYDQNQLTWRKTNTGYRTPPPSERETTCRCQAHERSEPIDDDASPKIRAWPIHESQPNEQPWKREILRVDIDECTFE